MNAIWANRLVAGTRKWAEVPASRKAGVKAELASRVENGKISAEQYEEITGESSRSCAASVPTLRRS